MEKAIWIYLALCEKFIALPCEVMNVINHFFFFLFFLKLSHNQSWLLPDPLNQTKYKEFWGCCCELVLIGAIQWWPDWALWWTSSGPWAICLIMDIDNFVFFTSLRHSTVNWILVKGAYVAIKVINKKKMIFFFILSSFFCAHFSALKKKLQRGYIWQL